MEKDEFVKIIKSVGFYRVFNPPPVKKFVNEIAGEFYKLSNHNKEYYYIRINEACCIDFDSINILDDMNQMIEFYLDMHRVAHIKFENIIDCEVDAAYTVILDMKVRRFYPKPMNKEKCLDNIKNFFELPKR